MIRVIAFVGVMVTFALGAVAAALADLVETKHLLIAGAVLPVLYGMSLWGLGAARKAPARWISLSFWGAALLLYPWLVLRQYFGGFSLSALLYHMQEGVQEGMPAGTILPILAASVVVGCFLHATFTLLKRLPGARVWLLTAALLQVVVNPFAQAVGVRLYFALSGNATGVLADLVTPELRDARPGKNLVLIYLEGVEATYEKSPVFGDAYKELADLKEQGKSFSGVSQMPMTAWTSAGFVASQCGVPLVPRGFASRNRIDNSQSYMPGVTCLGDLLRERGYQVEMYLGSDATFAGKRAFLETHGFSRIHDIEDLIEGGATDLGNWGVLDGELMQAALLRLSELEQSNEPYLLSLLTVGTHGPAAELAAECRGDHDPIKQDDILEGVRCTAQLVSDFMEKAQDVVSPDNTVFVLLSDHLAHPKVSAYWELSKYDRVNTFIALGAGVTPGEIAKQGAMIDVFPTLLDLIDLPATGQKAGLGVSLLSDQAGWTLAQSNWEMRQRLLQDANLITRLWSTGVSEQASGLRFGD